MGKSIFGVGADNKAREKVQCARKRQEEQYC